MRDQDMVAKSTLGSRGPSEAYHFVHKLGSKAKSGECSGKSVLEA